MSFTRLLDKKSLVFLGLNSGTSADGLDLAVVRISRRGRGTKIDYIDGTTRKYPPNIREAILTLTDASSLNLDEFLYLDNLLGEFYGRAAKQFVQRLENEGVRVNAIASHGQTVRHLPAKKTYLGKKLNASLQIGSLSHIATVTGLTTIGDFRQADIALGGEGAPVTTMAMRQLFGTTKESRLIVNIGGISNYFYFGPAKKTTSLAADCGPGNSLSDILSHKLHKKSFDQNGRKAAQGEASERLLSLLFAEPFFTLKQRSTGREAFGPALVERMIGFATEFGLSPVDLLATAAEFTTRSIAMAVWPVLCSDESLTKLYLTGGGRKNTFFASRLGHHLPDVTVHSIDSLGIDGDLVEASCFAVMGEMALRGIASDDGAVSRRGERAAPIRGQIVQPPVVTYAKN